MLRKNVVRAVLSAAVPAQSQRFGLAAVADGRYSTTVVVADSANTLLAVATDELAHTTEVSITVFLV